MKYDLSAAPRIIAGTGADICSIFFKSHGLSQPVTFLAALFLLIISITDTLTSKIPNLCTAACLLIALGYHGLTAGPGGLFIALQGLALGFLFLLGPYLLGGMGAGDVKALAALGTLIGPGPIFQTCLYMGLVGGLMSVLHYALSGRLQTRLTAWWAALSVFAVTQKTADLLPADLSEKLRFPYAAAIAFGHFAFLTWGPLVIF